MDDWTYQEDEKGGGGYRVYNSRGDQVAVILTDNVETVHALVAGRNALPYPDLEYQWQRLYEQHRTLAAECKTLDDIIAESKRYRAAVEKLVGRKI